MSFRAWLIRLIIRLVFRRLSPDMDVLELRQRFEKAERRRRIARGVQRSSETIAGVECEWLTPARGSAESTLLYLHGGGALLWLGASVTCHHFQDVEGVSLVVELGSQRQRARDCVHVEHVTVGYFCEVGKRVRHFTV